MIIDEVIQHVTDVLNDAGMVTWKKRTVVRAIHSGVVNVTCYRPDSFSARETVDLVAGVDQTLPDGAHRILDSVCAVDAGGSDTLPVFIRKKPEMYNIDPLWYSQPATLDIEDVIYDERVPLSFQVYPPAQQGAKVKLILAKVPGPFDSEQTATDTFPLSLKYLPAVVEWALYVLFAADKPETPNYGRGQAHKAAFFDLMGIKSQSDASASSAQKGR